jgi:hypothetical protein
VQEFLAEKDIPTVTQAPYPPGLAPSDFWLFPTLKMTLNGIYFATMEVIKSNVTGKLQEIKKKKSSTCASNNGEIDGASVCVCACAHTRKKAHFEGD